MSRSFGSWTVYSAGAGNGQRLQLAVSPATTWDEEGARKLLQDLTEAVAHAYPRGAEESADPPTHPIAQDDE